MARWHLEAGSKNKTFADGLTSSSTDVCGKNELINLFKRKKDLWYLLLVLVFLKALV